MKHIFTFFSVYPFNGSHRLLIIMLVFILRNSLIAVGFTSCRLANIYPVSKTDQWEIDRNVQKKRTARNKPLLLDSVTKCWIEIFYWFVIFIFEAQEI